MVYVVAIEGTIGAGKSSLVSQLSKEFSCFPEPVEEWSLLQNFYDDMYAYSLPFQLQVLLSYHKMYSNLKDREDTVIIERCPWSSHYIFTKMLVNDGYIQENDYKLYRNIYNKIAFKPDATIYLKVDSHTAYKRILNRDRASERSLELFYLKNLTTIYDDTMYHLNDVYVVDATKPLSEVKNKVSAILKDIQLQP